MRTTTSTPGTPVDISDWLPLFGSIVRAIEGMAAPAPAPAEQRTGERKPAQDSSSESQ
jgi:hypothetical protein